jgi:hypothetical protein
MLEPDEPILSKVVEQLKSINFAHKEISDIQTGVFKRVDKNEKTMFETKSGMEALTILTDNKLEAQGKTITTVNENITTKINEFKTKELDPVSKSIKKYSSGMFMVKVIYPIIFILTQVVIGVGLYFALS